MDKIPLLRRVHHEASQIGADCFIKMNVSTNCQLVDELEIAERGVEDSLAPLMLTLHIRHDNSLPHGEFHLVRY